MEVEIGYLLVISTSTLLLMNIVIEVAASIIEICKGIKQLLSKSRTKI
jgi:hypothetical protein